METEYQIIKTQNPIVIDGNLSDEAWKSALLLKGWVETNPGDNIMPKVKNTGYLIYDRENLYVGFYFHEPKPELIRAPVADRDRVPPPH